MCLLKHEPVIQVWEMIFIIPFWTWVTIGVSDGDNLWCVQEYFELEGISGSVPYDPGNPSTPEKVSI